MGFPVPLSSKLAKLRFGISVARCVDVGDVVVFRRERGLSCGGRRDDDAPEEEGVIKHLASV
jgi:hypothetical protein